MEKVSTIEVNIRDLSNHPCCLHGPTLLFTRITGESLNEKRNFYACAACRDRKDCSFFVWEDELCKKSDQKREIWEKERLKLLRKYDHKKLFSRLNFIKQSQTINRFFCHKCSILFTGEEKLKHEGHEISFNVNDYLITHPTELIKPKENAKKEAQYLFSQNSVKVIVNALKNISIKHVLCIGSPRIHEYILNECHTDGMTSLLLDIDDRFYNFFGPLEFCWYNSFNHYFFGGKSSISVFESFLKSDNGCGIAIVTDPPFGGRVEPLAEGLRKITEQYQTLNNNSNKLPIMWIFPYFMEPQILISLPEFHMLDYKVDYQNHSLFTGKPSGRKYGSPVRIFTNISPRKISLPKEEGYRFCKKCQRWVYAENKHCNLCKKCPSKDGKTYVHCEQCKRCVKPTWKHCDTCDRCCLPDHKCGQFSENKCMNGKRPGHKKRECKKSSANLSKKLKKTIKKKKNMKKYIKNNCKI